MFADRDASPPDDSSAAADSRLDRETRDEKLNATVASRLSAFQEGSNPNAHPAIMEAMTNVPVIASTVFLLMTTPPYLQV
jgi:hypothetical protein